MASATEVQSSYNLFRQKIERNIYTYPGCRPETHSIDIVYRITITEHEKQYIEYYVITYLIMA